MKRTTQKILLACIEETDTATGRTVHRYGAASALEMHVGEPGVGADEVLRAFFQKTNRNTGLRKGERLERVSEPMLQASFIERVAQLRRKLSA